MTDTGDHTSDGTPDDDLRALVRAAGAPAGIDFRADLRARLAATIDGDVELDPVEPTDRRRTWLPIVAAAAVVALLVGTMALIARDRDPEVVPSSDLATQLVGRTWVAMDGVPPGDLPTLVVTIGTTRPDVFLLDGDDGCNSHVGEFRLDGATVVDAEIAQTLTDCGGEPVSMPVQGASLSIEGDVLTVSSGQGASAYRALESLPMVSPSDLDGAWSDGVEQLTIDDGRVTAPVLDGIATDIDRALAEDTLNVWLWGDVVIVRTPTTGFRLLEPVGAPAPATLLDQIIGRIWVGVDGPWRTASPTLVFDSLDRDPGLWAVSAFDGCNAGTITFRLDGDTMTATEGGLTEAACEHTTAGLTNGTTLALDGGTLTVSDGAVTTSYVALDSLARIPDPALDGAWVIAGAEFSITGDTAQTAQGSEDLAAAVGRGIAAEPVAAWPLGEGWILGTGDTYLQLAPSDLPYGVDPVVTTGELEVGEAALITGTVVLERGCLVVREGDLRWPIVWQPGTAWDRSIGQIVLPGGVFLARGTRIEAGGGYHPLGDVTMFGVDADGIETLTRCADLVGDEIAVIQSPVSPAPPNPSG